MRCVILACLTFILTGAAVAQAPRDSAQVSRDLDEDLGPGIFRDCAVCPEMKELLAGGDVTTPFAIGRFEVTRDQFGEFLRATGHAAPNACAAFQQREDHPVVCVKQSDAEAYAAWLSQMTGRRYSLPTASQWDHAAGKVAVNSPTKTAPAGMSEANANGLYDMAGNAAELTTDGVRGGADRPDLTGFRVAAEVK